MLTTVTLKQDMRPWRKGDDIHIAPSLADALVKSGEAENPRPFQEPNPLASRAVEAPRRAILGLGRKPKR